MYLLYDSDNNVEEYMYCLANIGCFIEEYHSPYVFTCGDFNTNLLSDCRFGSELSTCSDHRNVKISDQVINPEGMYTFYSETHNSVLWLDHIVTTNYGHGSLSCLSKSFYFWIEQSTKSVCHWKDYLKYLRLHWSHSGG